MLLVLVQREEELGCTKKTAYYGFSWVLDLNSMVLVFLNF